MDEIWVYENWTNKRIRVHFGDCGHCNHGKGHDPKHSEAHGKWHGPFDDSTEATRVADDLRQQHSHAEHYDMRVCGVCAGVSV